MKDFQDIERIFNRDKRAYWTLFNAKGKRVASTSSDIMKISDEGERIRKSFEFLETCLEDEGEGTYKIYLRTSENAGKAQFEHTFQYGEVVEPFTKGNDKVEKKTSIAGLGSIAGLDFITGIMQSGRNEVDRLRDEKHKLELALLRKEIKIGNLESELNAPKSDDDWRSIIKGITKDYFPEILEKAFPNVERPVIASLKSRKHVAPPPLSKEVKTEDMKPRLTAAFESLQERFDSHPVETLERLEPVFDGLETLFPDDDPIQVLEVILKMANTKQGKRMIVPMVQAELDKLSDEEDDKE